MIFSQKIHKKKILCTILLATLWIHLKKKPTQREDRENTTHEFEIKKFAFPVVSSLNHVVANMIATRGLHSR